MSDVKCSTPRGWRAATGQKHTKPASSYSLKISADEYCVKRLRRYFIFASVNDGPFEIQISGRNADTLERLIIVDQRGIAATELNPGNRLAAYIYELRKLGLNIDTWMEPHGGQYAGRHARYVLQSIVMRGGEV